MAEKKQKPGKVIRVDPTIWNHIQDKRKPRESISALLRRCLGLPSKKGDKTEGEVFYILPESKVVCRTLAEAKGEAILQAIKAGKKKPTEKPIEVRVVS